MTYSLEPLAQAHGVTLAALGRHLGVSGSTWKQYRDEGVSWVVADRLATKVGLHPASVWPEWADELIAQHEVECASETCTERFVPNREGHRFCCRRCAKAQRSRDRYRTDPEFAERERRRRRAYIAEAREYVRRDSQRRYWADPERWRQARRDRYRQQQSDESEAV